MIDKFDINNWNDIKTDYANGSLILGNGASVAVHKEFSYKSLFDAAKKQGFINTPVQEIFQKFETEDFEYILQKLITAKYVNEALKIDSTEVDGAYQTVQEALIKTVQHVHVSYEKTRKMLLLTSIYNFLMHFRNVFSLNYDLIVYWAMMAGNEKKGYPKFKDGFYNPGSGNLILHDNYHSFYDKGENPEDSTMVFYPHGNLILVQNCQGNEFKINRNGETQDLLQKIFDQWKDNSQAPIFVSEAESKIKLNRIHNSEYLSRIYHESLCNVEESVVIYGWSMSEQDDHILQAMGKSTKLKKVAISVRQPKDSEAKTIQSFNEKCQKFKSAINKYIGQPVIQFFDAESEGTWCHSAGNKWLSSLKAPVPIPSEELPERLPTP